MLNSLDRWLGVGLLACSLAAPSLGLAEEEQQPVPPAPSATAASPAGPAFVHLEAEPRVSLRRREGRFGAHVCDAPCDVTVDATLDQAFYLEGLSFEPEPLRLVPDRRNEIALEGDHGLQQLGLVLLITGGGALGVGGFVFAFHGFFSSVYDEELPADNVALYSSLMGGGALLLGVGIPLFVAFVPKVVVQVTESTTVAVRPDGLAVQF